MTIPTQAEKAARFAKLHESGCFILPNAWDVPSAALIAEAGFPALATTSSGIAMAGGILDGEKIGAERMFAVVSEIARRVPLPVTGDLEAGYGPGPEHVAASVTRAIRCGMVGANIEDKDPVTNRLFPLEVAAERIRAGVAAAKAAGLPDFVLNARTDPFLIGWSKNPEENFAEAVRRARAYWEAGAKSIFVPALFDAASIARVAEAIRPAPLNVMVSTGRPMPPLDELRRAGLRRLTLGGSLMLASYGFTKRTLAALARPDAAFDYAADGITHAEMSALLVKYA
ncbi:MAG TPA: isocitrate lyase/phosphoenolpyruvate mutase family protein [Ferrovibrio sp.]|uniref:isocitrate lyase/PEP mutase family protein n=1 Tax=Ferrovibrio sp. TaxID=1917215 RepID=UPI002B4B2C29|nr:isocitrate lyase/phosphoenolpyruvate mutase family protein [Ferrovibrio sp.]HLT77189.1 isocitrate lyase/phosphoenolpyruvate mutase family protein [Ferrovibrio sp.]